MNKQFLSQLTKLQDYEFFVLEHHFHMARMIRDAMTKNAISEKEMAGILGVSFRKMTSVKMGSYPFDLRMLSKLQAHLEKVAAWNAKIKIEAESIGFNHYKDQYPAYITKIEELIKVLEYKTTTTP